MTTAESNNEQATLEEYGDALQSAANDAINAGIRPETVARHMITCGISLALESGVPVVGLRNIDDYVEHLLKVTLAARLHTGAENETPRTSHPNERVEEEEEV